MRKVYLRILIAIIGVAGLGMTTKGQGLDQIVFHTSHEFVVSGKMLPAGRYRVIRVSLTNPRALILNSLETRTSAFILATQVENNHTAKTEVSLEQVGGVYALSKIA